MDMSPVEGDPGGGRRTLGGDRGQGAVEVQVGVHVQVEAAVVLWPVGVSCQVVFFVDPFQQPVRSDPLTARFTIGCRICCGLTTGFRASRSCSGRRGVRITE
jgi:hypothetical protein